jgi:beta-glucanase (GH16 family)
VGTVSPGVFVDNGVTIPVVGGPWQVGPATPRLVWADGFTADLSKWNVRTDSQSNHYGWNTPANCAVRADGLHITARRQTGLPGQPVDKPYTTGYIDTIGKFSQPFGRWEIDAKLPTARGLWPAFWLRGDTTKGEIDIMEAVGGLPTEIVQTVHENTNAPPEPGDKSGFECKPLGFRPDVFHTYAFERLTDGTVRWSIDGAVTRTRAPLDIDNQQKPMTWLNGPNFASPWNLRINLQVGGSMPKSFGLDVDPTSALPDDLVIRAVRIYDTGGTG